MKHVALIIHLAALTTVFATFGQPSAETKPAGIRRAVETVAKSKYPMATPYMIKNGIFLRLAD